MTSLNQKGPGPYGECRRSRGRRILFSRISEMNYVNTRFTLTNFNFNIDHQISHSLQTHISFQDDLGNIIKHEKKKKKTDDDEKVGEKRKRGVGGNKTF